MFTWEDKYYKIEEHDHICKNIESIGTRINELCDPKRVPIDEQGRRWFKDFKIWEYPFVYDWIKRYAKNVSHKIKIMDFGCWMCPFPEFLANEFNAEIWGVDNDDWGDIKNIGYEKVRKSYSQVNYFFKNVEDLEENDFDLIFSCSVLEHIPQEKIISILKCLKSKLNSSGKMLHVADFYFPEKPGREGKRINFYDVCTVMDYEIDDYEICPGSLRYNFENVIKKINFLRDWNQEARIAIGDD
jgi:hypothetical protein